MAILTDADRAELRSMFTKEASNVWDVISVNKSDLKATVDAIDQWVEDNQAGFNSAIPLPARMALSAKQKVQFLFYVVRKRWEVE